MEIEIDVCTFFRTLVTSLYDAKRIAGHVLAESFLHCLHSDTIPLPSSWKSIPVSIYFPPLFTQTLQQSKQHAVLILFCRFFDPFLSSYHHHQNRYLSLPLSFYLPLQQSISACRKQAETRCHWLVQCVYVWRRDSENATRGRCWICEPAFRFVQGLTKRMSFSSLTYVMQRQERKRHASCVTQSGIFNTQCLTVSCMWTLVRRERGRDLTSSSTLRSITSQKSTRVLFNSWIDLTFPTHSILS